MLVLGPQTTHAFLLSAGASVTAGGTSTTGVAAFNDTFTWGGVLSVRAEGALVEGFTAPGSDGIDWRRPVASVPEPSTALLLGLGVGGVALGRRFHSRMPPAPRLRV